jgi:hypothetical protein
MATSAKTESTPVVEMMVSSEYFDKYHPELHPYVRAYISGSAYDTIKSRSEWDSLVKFHMSSKNTEE